MIRRLIADHRVATQEELVELLLASGFSVTQAPVSRDIRDLNLMTTVGSDGKSYYGVRPDAEEDEQEEIPHYLIVLRESFVSAHCAGNLLVIRTAVGMAMAFAAALDSLHIHEIIGSIAGDDTIFLAMGDEEDCRRVQETVLSLTRKE